jgi:hypothetical protein
MAARDAGVTDIVGSVLLVGITVLAASGLGLLVLSFDGPADRLHVDVELRTVPGADGAWATGDERLQLVHLGGEALPRDGTRLTLEADGAGRTYQGGQLGDAFADGELSIGEAWTSPASAADYLTVDQEEAVAAMLVYEREGGQLLASGAVSGGGIVPDVGGGSCSPDVTAPTVALSHSPPDLTSASGTAAVTVTASATDACGPVDASVAPRLWYRIAPGPSPGPATFVDLGAMSPQAGATWTRSIPAPAGGWMFAWGQRLEFHVTGVQDTAPTPNVLLQGPTRSDTVELVGAAAFAHYPVAVAGTFAASAPFAAVQADDGVYAQVVEACTLGPPVSNAQTLCGSTAGGVSVTSASNALTSNDQRSSQTGSGTSVHATGFDVPQSTTATLSSFTISYEGQRGGGGATNPTVQLEYQFDPSCAGAWTAAGASFSVTGTADSTVTRTVTAGAPYDVAEIESLCVRARVTNAATRPLLTDALLVSVAYPSATTTYDLNVEFGWSNLAVSGSSTGLLDVDHRVAAGESYTVQKFNGAAWVACPGTLSSTSGDLFRCTLTNAELQAGSPLVRIVGAADAGAPSALHLDAVRLAVFS